MVDAIIVGAGAAGLAAAHRLCKAGLNCEILEARPRIGGRVFTLPSDTPVSPFELGAEFVHGKKNLIWELAALAELRIAPTRDQYWIVAGSTLRQEKDFDASLESLFQAIDSSSPDCSFDEFVRRLGKPIPNEWLLRQFVEGFNAADARRISVRSLPELDSPEETFRLQGGYVSLLERLRHGIESGGGKVFLNTIVNTVRWGQDEVEIVAETMEGPRQFRASFAVITLPLGVLQAEEGAAGRVQFEPEAGQTRSAFANLAMGKVTKVLLEFNDYLWHERFGEKDFGFAFSPAGVFRTWWSDSFAPIVTGWVGGPESESVSRRDREEILDQALLDLGRTLNQSKNRLREQLLDCQLHDWNHDPFSRGAYSYPTVGYAPDRRAEPEEGALVFAGEAMAPGAGRGTVHGALESGLRAAERILARNPAPHVISA